MWHTPHMDQQPKMMILRSDVLQAAVAALSNATHPATPWGVVNEILRQLQAAVPVLQPREEEPSP